MQELRLMVTLSALGLLACGSRVVTSDSSTPPGSDARTDAASRDGLACPSSAPTEGASCNFTPNQPCQYYLPGPCPGAVEVCRCMNGSWRCRGALLDGGPCRVPDGPPVGFCVGGSPHMVANGIDSKSPAVSGRAVPLNCCDAAEFVVVTQTVPMTLVPIVASWRAQVGLATLPATIDLANPPQGWNIQVQVGCDPAQGGCNPAPDSYSSGFTGTLQVARTANGGYDMSICLSVAEPAGSPHPLLHSLQLYAPGVTAGY